MRKQLRKVKLIRMIASQKITVVSLILLMLLTFWGTLYQAEYGLYAAQKRFFYSWFMLAGGFVPLPGALLVCWVFFVNLLTYTLVFLPFKKKKIGIVFIHVGLLLLMIGAGLTFHLSQESQITLQEGKGTNVSVDYHEWEISVWKPSGPVKQVVAWSLKELQVGKEYQFPGTELKFRLEIKYDNAKAFFRSEGDSVKIHNGSDLGRIEVKANDKDGARNIPGIQFTIIGKEGPQVILFGGEQNPTPLGRYGLPLLAQVRRIRYQIPFSLTLIDFKKEEYQRTSMAKSYESLVRVHEEDGEHESLVKMNEPLRRHGFTLYQSSYHVDQEGVEYSTLAVVENPARSLPYISCLVTGFGLMIHFIIAMFSHLRRTREEK